jgi:hypothetical protein
MTGDPSRFRQKGRSSERELGYRERMNSHIEKSPGTFYERLEHFPKYTSRQILARYLALYEIFKIALEVQGDIVECGVNWGGGLMALAQYSAVLEPVNLQRRVIGFDTFEGFPSIAAQDKKGEAVTAEMRVGGLAASCYEDILDCIALFDSNRSIGHIEKVLLVKGDANHTIPKFVKENPQLVVSMLHLDFDLYDPTKAAIESLVPRMPKGAVIVFDELNNLSWPGETVAVFDTLGLKNLRIKRFPFEPYISYAVLE